MNAPSDPYSQNTPVAPRRGWAWLRTLGVCALILALGAAGAGYIRKTAPHAQKRPPQRTVALVDTQPLWPGSHQVTVTAMGSVIPAREITLKTRVPGEIKSLHPEFVEGGLVHAGDRLIKIDPQDYLLAIARRESAVTDAEYALKVEMGYQQVARREWDLLNPESSAEGKDAELALRKPHLAKAKSDLAAARAELEQARLDLSRTDIPAPFNAIVRSKNVAVGSLVTTQDDLAELVGVDEYWIQVSLPVERLTWINIPRSRGETGASVTVHYRGNKRRGTVARLLSDLASEGRMARILVSVRDPLGLSADSSGSDPPMLIGEYVRVEIQGTELTDVYRIPRSALRDNGSIWILDKNDTLEILPVEILWRDAGHVLAKNGIVPGQRLIVSDLAVPVRGMPLRDSEAGAGAQSPAPPTKREKGDG